MADDLNFQNLSTVQNSNQPKPRTITAAQTIAPTTFLTKLSGTTVVATITPPVTGSHMIAVVAGTTTAAFTTTDNIVGITTAPTTTGPCLFVYDNVQAKYLRIVE